MTDQGAAPGAVFLLGPTAAGKSAIAMALARQRDIEIISVDSALVYRGMDIGTAKPTAEERRRVPHHLIDLLDPVDACSAASFAADARRLIDEIRGRGRLPLLVGGTMLYAKALNDGLDALPAADPAIRARLDAEAARVGWPALHARLRQIDPVTAARLEPGDSQRIQRALEVHALSGRPMSTLLTRGRGPNADPRAGPGQSASGDTRSTDGVRFPLPVVALEPSDRAVLHRRIALRFEAMLAAGFLDEVATLRARHDLEPTMPSMRCVGYRQAWTYLDGTIGREQMAEQAVAATRQLAKRQLTWLRSMTGRHCVDCLADDATQQVATLVDNLSDPSNQSNR
jgi:tRNA dimethylallyltransferase